MKSLSFKWEFFLLKIKKRQVESTEDDEEIRRGTDSGFTKTTKGEKLTVVSLQQKTSLRQCASKN